MHKSSTGDNPSVKVPSSQECQVDNKTNQDKYPALNVPMAMSLKLRQDYVEGMIPFSIVFMSYSYLSDTYSECNNLFSILPKHMIHLFLWLLASSEER